MILAVSSSSKVRQPVLFKNLKKIQNKLTAEEDKTAGRDEQIAAKIIGITQLQYPYDKSVNQWRSAHTSIPIAFYLCIYSFLFSFLFIFLLGVCVWGRGMLES